jgi:hypothetical protein
MIATEKIKNWLYKLNSLQWDLEQKYTQQSYIHEPDIDTQMRLAEIIYDLEDEFFHIAEKIYLGMLTFFEHNGLPEHLETCKRILNPFFKSKIALLVSGYHAPTGDQYSIFAATCWKLLSPFKVFDIESEDERLKKEGLVYLEHILESTAVIISSLGIVPTKEAEVYDAVKIVTKATFPKVIYPTESFQKEAKCYRPDILIPHLKCAVEYKYAMDVKRLIDTIDQILVDVKGYSHNRGYNLFYAVFYFKSGILTDKKFNSLWAEREFPDDWKGIIVFA